MEKIEDVVNLAPVPVFVDDTGRRRRLTRRVGRLLLIGFTAYIGLVAMGFARDPRLGPLHLPTIGLSDLGLMIPPAPFVLGEQTTRTPATTEIEVSTAGAPDGGVPAAASSGGRPGPNSGRISETPGRSTSPSGGTHPTGPATPGLPAGSSATTSSTATTTTTVSRGHSPKSTTTTTATTAPSTPSTTSPAAPGQGPVSAKGPDGSGPPGQGTEPPGQQRRTTTTTATAG